MRATAASIWALGLFAGYILGLVHWQLVEWWRERRVRRAESRR